MSGNTILIFFLIFFDFLKMGPTFLKIRQLRFDEFLRPMILKIAKKNITIINSKKYLNNFINKFT